VAVIVTIGVCIRNNEATLPEVINSIIDQDFPHELIEVIFVDDGSEDSSSSIVKSYAIAMDMSVKVFHHEWMGLGPSRNIVLDNTSGHYIIWVDGDMMLRKDHVRRQVEFMEAHPEIGIAGGKRGIFPAGSLIADLENVSFMVYDSDKDISDKRLPGTGGTIFRVSALKQIGGFDPAIRGVGEDLDAAYRIKAARWMVGKSDAVFFERGRQTWQGLWRQYLWHGYGLRRLYRRNSSLFSIAKMTPIAAFFVGLLRMPNAYRMVRRRSVILLPFHFAFKMMAWCFGFANGKLSDVGLE